MKIIKIVSAILVVPVVTLAFGILLAYPLKWAWNYVIPYLFGLPQIGALQAFCLLWVTQALIKPISITTKD